jgi:cell division protein FtsB
MLLFLQKIYLLMLSRFKEFYNKHFPRINVYWLVTIIFFILACTMGDSSLYKRYVYDEKIRSLEQEIKRYQKETEVNRKKLNDLRTDKEGLERFAREEYYMKKPGETIFIIKND